MITAMMKDIGILWVLLAKEYMWVSIVMGVLSALDEGKEYLEVGDF
jgi:hypothetical protein